MFDFLRDLGKSKEVKRQELIAAYLDDYLTLAEKQRFEEQLASDPLLRDEVDQQLLIKDHLQQLPQVRAPRNFTLDPALYGSPEPDTAIRLYPVLRTATVLVGIFFVIAVGAALFLPGGDRMGSMALAPLAQEAGEASRGLTVESEDGFFAAQAEEAAAPEIVAETIVESEEIVADAEMAVEAPAEEIPAPAEEQALELPPAETEGDIMADEVVAEEAEPQEPDLESEMAEEESGLGPAAPAEEKQMTEEALMTEEAAAELVSGTPMVEAPAAEAPPVQSLPTASPPSTPTLPLATPLPMEEVEPYPPRAATSIAQVVIPEEIPAETQEKLGQEDQASPRDFLFFILSIVVITLGIAVIILSAVTLLVRRKI